MPVAALDGALFVRHCRPARTLRHRRRQETGIMPSKSDKINVPSLTAVIAVHAGLLLAAWGSQVRVDASEGPTLYVTLISKNRPAPKPPKRELRRIAATTPVVKPEEPVVPPEPEKEKEPVAGAPPPLADFCVQRTPPVYPLAARRRGVQGRVILRVTVEPGGYVSQARVATSSGSKSLDEAALTAVKRWRCRLLPRTDGAVALTALQPFNFVLSKNGR